MTLWTPLEINGLRLDNRLIMLATHLGMCDKDGAVTDQLVEFYRERARYGPGMIIVGGCYTEHLGMSGPTMIGISRDEHVEGLSRLTEAIHEHGVPVGAQLYHAGRYAHSLILGQRAVSASGVKCRLTRETPRPLTVEEIAKTVDNFGRAASRAKEAGFDSVEIIGSAGYLINQFMARATNRRKDEYGGSLERRARFALEVVRSVREAVGSGFPVFYRISGEDFVPDGMTLEDNKIIAPWLVDAGVDVLSVTGGWHETRIPQITMDVPRGGYTYLAEGLSEVVDVPVVACNRINSVTIADRIIARGKVQLVGMSRGLIADPQLPVKDKSGQRPLTRPCIACNIGCLDRVFMIEPVTCALNPQAGYERERVLGEKGHGTVTVIGGGPAGMEASRVLALRGFTVTLFEEHDRLGGGLRLAARVPGRGEFAAYVSYMERELARLGVTVRTSTLATADTIVSGSYDHVVVATGTLASSPTIDGVELGQVTTAYDVLEHRLSLKGNIAVVGGRALGCHASLFIASPEATVNIFDEDDAIGVDIGRTTRWVILKHLEEKGVTLLPKTRVAEIEEKTITILKEGVYIEVETDAVVLATEPQPRDRLIQQLSKRGIDAVAIGSVNEPMNLLHTIHSAFDTANRLKAE